MFSTLTATFSESKRILEESLADYPYKVEMENSEDYKGNPMTVLYLWRPDQNKDEGVEVQFDMPHNVMDATALIQIIYMYKEIYDYYG